jgi:serine/threonine-protein kinase
VRLLDFGIAKLLEPEAEAAATRTELRLMTPEYASPEQILGEPVTTATDVHGMGVLLYELLAGVRPYEGSRRHDLERRIVEEDPLPPGKTAQGKQAGLNADLDAIVLKALEKNPAARYGSAVALMADVERYLGKRPVLARPPSWSYRAGRFVSRNRAASALGLACLLLVAGSAAISTYQSRLVRSERDAARSEHKKSETVVAVLTELLGAASPRQVPGAAEMTASEFLNRAEKLVVESRGMDAEVQARLRHVLGEVYRARSQYERARGHLESAWRQLRAIHGDSHEDAARAARDLARLVAQAGPPEQAIEMLRRSMDQMKSIYGESSRETAGAMRDLGSALSGARQKHLLTESLRIERSLGGAKPAAGVASALDALGRYHLSRGEVHEAGKYFDEAAGIFQATLPDGHPDTLAAMNNAITAHARLGEVKLAAQMHRGLIERQAKYLGENHIQVAHSYGNLGVALAEGGRYNEAGEAMRENIGRLRAILGKDHPQVASAVRNMARIMQMQGRYREALALMDQALGSLRPAPQPDAQAGLMRAQRAVLLLRTGRTREGRQLLEEAVATLRKMNPGGHYAAADGSVMLAFSLLARGEHHRAALLFDEAAAFRGAHLPAGHPKVAEAACGQALSRKAGWPDLQPCAAYQRWPLADPEDKKIAASLIASRGGHR